MGLLFLLGMTAASWVLAGPAAAGIAFFAIALVRVALHARALQLENEELKRRLSSQPRTFDPAEVEALQLELFGEEGSGPEAPPESGFRESVTGLRARRVSGED